MNLQEALDAFLTSCKADGLSMATVKWYRSVLSTWALKVPNAELSSFNAQAMRSYIVLLRERIAYLDAPQKPVSNHQMSRASVDSHVTALHAFWGWCEREYGISNPMANIRRPKPQQIEPKAIASADFVKLFNATGDDIAGTRDRAFLAFLADTGCRLGGVVKLKWEDVDLNSRRAVVTEKGQKSRTVVFTQITARLLLAWRYYAHVGAENVFTSVRAPYAALSPDGYQQILKRLKRRASITGRVNPHSFRHAFAREYLKNGGDIVTLARLMGHADINTTAKAYAVFTQDELAELHEKYSPLKGMMA